MKNWKGNRVGISSVAMMAAMGVTVGIGASVGGFPGFGAAGSGESGFRKCRRPTCQNSTAHPRGYCSAECCNKEKTRLRGEMK